MFSPRLISSYLDWFHNFSCSLLLGVLLFVRCCILFLLFNKYLFISVNIEYQFCELLCSVIPIFILFFQILPSIILLYLYGVFSIDADLTVKIVGHQWYWSYEISDFNFVSFDSYIKPLDDLDLRNLRNLEVDNRCVVPQGVNIRFCVTSSDVIHSWTLFNFFIKIDAISGLLNVFFFNFPVVGVYYGQCSEICGANHSFMPICLEVTLFDMFKFWCLTF